MIKTKTTDKRQCIAVKITAVLAVIAWIVVLATLFVLPAYAADDVITNLTGTTWEFKLSGITRVTSASFLNLTGSVEYVYNGLTYTSDLTSMSGNVRFQTTGNIVEIYGVSHYTGVASSGNPFFTNTSNVNGTKYTPSKFLFSITGGDGVTNANLIAWLQANATQVYSGYTLTFDTLGGSAISSYTGTEIPSDLALNYTPTRSGFTFGGWYYDLEFSNAVVAGDILSSNTTVYAKWISSSQTGVINYYVYDEFQESVYLYLSSSFSYGSIRPSDLTGITLNGYTFDGWYYKELDDYFADSVSAGDLFPLGSTLNLYCTLTNNNTGATPYTVNFNTLGGTMSTQSIMTSQMPDVDSVYIPLRSGFTFDGWYYDISYLYSALEYDSVSQDTVLYAKWISNDDYTVNYYLDGSLWRSYTFDDGIITSDIISELVVPTGYTFDGWYYYSNYTQRASVGDLCSGSTFNLYGRQLDGDDLPSHIITFNSLGGSSLPSVHFSRVPVNFNSTYVPIRTSNNNTFIFGGWYWDMSFTSPVLQNQVINSDSIVYAKWELSSHVTITYYLYGSRCNILSYEFGTLDQQAVASSTNGSLLFDGWYFNSDYTGALAQIGDLIDSDITLYGRFVDDPEDVSLFSIYFNTNGGNYIAPISVNSIPDDLPRPVRVGYIFDGWYYSNDFSVSVNAGDGFSGSIWIYAKWQVVQSGDSYQDGYNDAQNDNSTLKTIINASWSAFYESFVDFTSRTTIGGISIISVLATLIVIVLLFIAAKLFLGGIE